MHPFRALTPGRALACALAFLIATMALIYPSLTRAASNVVEFSYDAAGNITDIKRQVASGFAITSLDPGSGAVGATVTIYGTGFSATPSSNLVKFNGVTATVSAATSGSLSTTVPASASTGRVTVTLAGQTATSPQDFVVVVPGAPTITSFTPTNGGSATSVSVAGTNFDTVSGATVVKLNGVVAAAAITSSTALSFSVPASASSGRITATTTVGTGSSAQDFLVPPSGVSAADIVVIARIQPGGAPAGVSLPPTSKHALLLFDGAADGYYTVQLGQYGSSPSIATTPYKIIKPDNTVLATGVVGTSTARPTIHIPKLPVTGTYSILISPGPATFDANIRVAADPIVVIDGAAENVALAFQGQTARMAFNAAAGKDLGVGILGLALTPTNTSGSAMTIFNPDGSVLANPGSCYAPAAGNLEGNCDLEVRTSVAGVHTMIFDIAPGAAASFSAQISEEVTGAITMGGGLDVALTRPGQDGRYTFSAATGDNAGLDLSGILTTPASRALAATIRRPNGTILGSLSATQPDGAYLDLGTISTAGTYTIALDPAFAAYGTARFSVKQGNTLSTSDSPAAFATTYIGESVRYRFVGSSGQNVSIGVSDLAYVGTSANPATLTVYKPDATAFSTSVSCAPTVMSGRCRLLMANLPASGTYGIVLRPPSGVRLTGNLAVSADLSGTLSAGVAQSLTATRAGQAARYTFSGTAGDSVAVKLFGITTTPSGQNLTITVYTPSGSILSGTTTVSGTNSKALEIPNLPTTGT